MPTTLTSGVTLTIQAKGNGALALMMVVGSNLLGILTVPFMLRLVLREGADVHVNAVGKMRSKKEELK